MPPKSSTIQQLSDKLDSSLAELKTDILRGMNAEIVKINDSINEMKDTIIQNLIEENNRLSNLCRKLKGDFARLEAAHVSLEQYTRRNNLVISGVPDVVDDGNLVNTVVKLLNAVDVPASTDSIEACHSLSKREGNKPVIVRFLNRKLVEASLSKTVRRKLRDLNFESIGLNNECQIYFNENLCPSYRTLAWKCRYLRNTRNIVATSVRNGVVLLKVSENDNLVKVTSEGVFTDLFPDFVYPN